MAENLLADQKAAIRKQLKQIRASIPAPVRMAYSEAIFNFLIGLDEIHHAKSAFIYISYGNEVDTHQLLKYFLHQEKLLAIPKILATKNMIAAPFSGEEELVPGELGILTVAGEEPFNTDIDIVITPGLGFTRTGYRIGYGRGYYDKWFARNPVGHKIAVTFEAQIVDSLPVAVTDIPVDIIVTEKRIIRI